MTVNAENILLSLAAGVVIGLLAVIFRFFASVSAGKWLAVFLQDATFVFIMVLITFLVSFPISMGRVRLLQVVLEFLSFALVWLLLSPLSDFLSRHYINMRKKLEKFIGRIRQRSANKAKKRRRISKKPKKTLDISPSGNI